MNDIVLIVAVDHQHNENTLQHETDVVEHFGQ